MKLVKIQLLISLVGTVFAFYNVAVDFISYHLSCGTWLPSSRSFIHPFFTPCFYGAFAFLLTFILSVVIFKTKSLKVQKYLVGLSAFGVAFAWGNMALEINKYISAGSKAYKGCSGAVVSNPFFTPCFGGSVIFIMLLITAFLTLRRLKRLKTNQ